MKREAVRGSCLCGGVRYEVTGPFLRAGHCHCSRCRKHSGAAVCTQGRVRREHFRLVAGAELIRNFVEPGHAGKAFCTVCGSSLFGGSWPDGPEVSIRLGTLDDDPGIRPQRHTFVDSRAPWDEITDDLPQHSASAPPLREREQPKHGERRLVQGLGPGHVPLVEPQHAQRPADPDEQDDAGPPDDRPPHGQGRILADMYIAMNHFRIAAGRGDEFERIWSERESYLDDVPGFVQFHLVRTRDEEDGTHRYASHTIWTSRQAFVDWTHSEAFRKAHGERRSPEGLLLAHPRFEGWQAVDLERVKT